MLDFKKEHDILVCIDSDGTIMDTMTIKHERCFGPEFIKTFSISSHQDEILKEWNRINLYSLTRGINRFQGLNEILKYVKKFYYYFDGEEEFDKWVNSTNEFSTNSIKKYMENCLNNNCFSLALLWSNNVNNAIDNLPPSTCFNNVDTILKDIANKVDLLGVSSANEEAVKEEWTRLNIISLFKEVACQNKGTKSLIISQGLQLGYSKKKTIMLGDALGDLEAAKNNKVFFFPIIPMKEEESWLRFYNEGLVKLLNDEFDTKYQNQLIKEFKNELK